MDQIKEYVELKIKALKVDLSVCRDLEGNYHDAIVALEARIYELEDFLRYLELVNANS